MQWGWLGLLAFAALLVAPAAAAENWPMHRLDQGRTAATGAFQPGDGSHAWTNERVDRYLEAPVVADGTIWLVGEGRILGLDLDTEEDTGDASPEQPVAFAGIGSSAEPLRGQPTTFVDASIRVTANVTNPADRSRTVEVTLEVDGETFTTKTVELDPGETRSVVFRGLTHASSETVTYRAVTDQATSQPHEVRFITEGELMQPPEETPGPGALGSLIGLLAAAGVLGRRG